MFKETVDTKSFQQWLSSIFIFNKYPTFRPSPEGIYCQAVDPSNTRVIHTTFKIDNFTTDWEPFSLDIERLIKAKTTSSTIDISTADNDYIFKIGRLTLTIRKNFEVKPIQNIPSFDYQVKITSITPKDFVELLNTFSIIKTDSDKAIRFAYEDKVFTAIAIPDKTIKYELPTSCEITERYSSKFSFDLTMDLSGIIKAADNLTIYIDNDKPITFTMGNYTSIMVTPRISED